MVRTILPALALMMPHPAKLLTATHESEMKPDSAWIYLNQIPDDNAENTAFKELYTQLLQGIQPPAGSGKAMGLQELYLRQSAMQEQKLYAPMAQAVNASYFGETYHKNVKNLRSDDRGMTSAGSNNLFIYPNPVTNAVTIRLDHHDGKTWSLQIYDLLGVLQKTYTCNGNVLLLSVDLPNGMYVCRAADNAKILGIQKLFMAK